jgi:alkylation response protein AidB-like acyl-CoA dehydrogenase
VDRSRGIKGITAFIVPASTPGISGGKKEHKMGLRCSNTTDVILDDVMVPVGNRLGDEGEGFKIAMKTLNKARINVGASATGVARAAMDAAASYSKQRIQFGKSISEFQAIQFMLADMAIQIEAARMLVWQAAFMEDRGLPCMKEAAIAKTFASDMAMKVTTDAVQVFGGYGFTREFLVEKYMRDVKIMQIYDGTNQIQRMIIARQLLQNA